jgi:hypothetical protein
VNSPVTKQKNYGNLVKLVFALAESHGFCWCYVLHLYFVLFMICCSVRIMGNDTLILS